MLTCTACRRPVSDCQCADGDARLRAVAHGASADVMFKWCRACDRHYARCRCGTPDFYIVCGGRDVTAEFTDGSGVRNLLGQRVLPDLRRR